MPVKLSLKSRYERTHPSVIVILECRSLRRKEEGTQAAYDGQERREESESVHHCRIKNNCCSLDSFQHTKE